jgi:hypothetical protein
MSTLRALVMIICVATTAAGLVLARRDARHRPVAGYLAAVLGLDLLRLGLHQVLPPGSGERHGVALLLRHLDQGAYLGVLLAPAAMAMSLFLRRRPWPIVVAGAAAWAMVVLSYPALRGADLLRFYTAVELAGGLAAAGMFVTWARSSWLSCSVPIMAGIVLIAASLASIAVPALTGAGALARWPAIVALNGVALAAVLALQLRALQAPETTS